MQKCWTQILHTLDWRKCEHLAHVLKKYLPRTHVFTNFVANGEKMTRKMAKIAVVHLGWICEWTLFSFFLFFFLKLCCVPVQASSTGVESAWQESLNDPKRVKCSGNGSMQVHSDLDLCSPKDPSQKVFSNTTSTPMHSFLFLILLPTKAPFPKGNAGPNWHTLSRSLPPFFKNNAHNCGPCGCQMLADLWLGIL